ncbi:unnamed protein product [Musa acuminata var. zebrina]
MELLGAEEEAPQGAGPPRELAAFLQPRSVSTGLGLSLDDRRVASSSGEWPLIILLTIDEDIDREVRRIDADIDWFIKSERYKTLGAEVGTNDQDIRLQDHKNGSVWDHHEAWGHFENAKEPMCDQCYLEPITRCSVVGSSCTNALSIHTADKA